MAQYPRPSSSSGTFNNNTFTHPDTGGLTIDEAKQYFVTFPVTQSPSTITANNLTTTGALNIAGDSQFGGDVTFIGGATLTGPLTLSDNMTVQGTTTLDDTLLCLTTVTITDLLTCEGGIDISTTGDGITFPDGTIQTTAYSDITSVHVDQDNTFLSPFIQTFEGIDTGINGTNAPLRFSNSVTDEYGSLFVDPSTNTDLTIYSNQSLGGLTVRNINGFSYTCNPISGNIANFKNPLATEFGLTGQSLAINTTGQDSYIIDSKSTQGFGLTVVNQSGNAKLSLSNNGPNVASITCTAGNVLDFGASDLNTTGAFNISTSTYFSSGINTGINNNQLIVNNVYPYIYFALYDTEGVQKIPLNIYVNSLFCNANLNMNNNTITNAQSIGGNAGFALNVTTPLNMASGQGININNAPLYIYSGTEFSSIDQNSTLNQLTIYNNAPHTDNTANIAFNLNTPSGSTNTPYNVLQLYPNEIDIKTLLNMNGNSINNVNTLNGTTGGTLTLGTQVSTSIRITGGVLTAGLSLGVSTANGNFDLYYYTPNNLTFNIGSSETLFIANQGVNVMSFNSTGITASKTLNMNSNNITNIGSGSTAFTQANGNSTTAIATTQFVADAVPKNYSSTLTIVAQNAGCNISPSSTPILVQQIGSNINFINGSFTATLSSYFIGLQLQFTPRPWPNFPPSSSNSFVNAFCVQNSTTYTCTILWQSTGMIISIPTTAPLGNGVQYLINLVTIGNIPNT